MDEDDIFNDGWRDPTDDGRRVMVYVLFLFGFLMGLGLIGAGIVAAATGRFPGAKAHELSRMPVDRAMGWICFLTGICVSSGIVWFFAKERKHWDLRGLNAERSVAGGFVLGFAFIGLGLMFLRGANGAATPDDAKDFEAMMALTFGLIGIGATDLLLFLAIGLICAFWLRIAVRPRTLVGAFVVGRFALDDKAMESPDHPCPATDGLIPMVRLRANGRLMLLRSTQSAYKLAEPGRSGTATVRGDKLTAFSMKR